MIVIVCGPPGAGKTTIATRARDRLAAAGLQFRLLHSDDYARRTYEQLFERVRAELDADWLVDGTFYERAHRVMFDRLRARTAVYTVYVRASLSTCLERNRRRDGISERGLRVVHAEFEPPRADLKLDTDDRSIGSAVRELVAAIRRWHPEADGVAE